MERKITDALFGGVVAPSTRTRQVRIVQPIPHAVALTNDTGQFTHPD
jgi:hypothetical protein